MDKKKRDYLMFKIRGRLVKVDPDIFYKIRSGQHETPCRKYNDDITSMRINSENYAVIIRGEKPPRKHILLSRFVMDAKEGQIIDHRNRNPLDNRRKNLRIVTKRQNCLNKKCENRSGYIGVSIKHRKGRNYCQAKFQTGSGKELTFQLPDSPQNRVIAAFARDKFVLAAGDEEYAPLNFPCFKNEPFRSYLLKEDLRSRAEVKLCHRYRQNNGNEL
jgi:hypothetical protein